MQAEFDKIHSKLDAIESRISKIDDKLDLFQERLSKVEANQTWLKTGLLAVFAWIGSHFFKG